MTKTSARIDIWNKFGWDNPAQVQFIKSKAKYRLLSSGYGGGKSLVLCRESIRHAIEYPGSRNMISRLTFPDLERSTHVTFRKCLRDIGFNGGSGPGPRHYIFNKQTMTYKWWNGSETIFTNLDDEEKFGSVEASTWAIDEGSEVPDSVYQILFPGRLRWHLPGCDAVERTIEYLERGEDPPADLCHCPARGWVCTNPGASGYLRAVTKGLIPDWEWIRVPAGANRYNPREYNAELEQKARLNGPAWYARYVEGSWDAFEGQRFTMFDRDTHILPAPFRPTDEHSIVEGWDFGHRETFVVWLAYRPDGEEPIVVFDELQVREVEQPLQVAAKVKEIRARYGLDERRIISLGDPAGVAATTFSALSPIQAYARHGIMIAPCTAGKNPVARSDRIAELLSRRMTQPDGSSWPGLVFGPNCTAVVESLINLRWKPKTSRLGEEPREQFVKIDDHGVDALGYAIVGVLPPLTKKEVHEYSPDVAVPLQVAWRRRFGGP